MRRHRLSRAKKERYGEAGHLTCVSESPIDAKLLCTYQDYNVSAEAGPR